MPPYPRPVVSERSISYYRYLLDYLFEEYQGWTEGHRPITVFLTTGMAKKVYEAALAAFKVFKVKYPENKKIYKDAMDFYRRVPDHYTERWTSRKNAANK